MLKAAWKSLLGRKTRLVMSTFAIVLGVAFVVGTYVFTDTLNKSFVQIFSSSVGDVVVRPAQADSGDDSTGTEETITASEVARLAEVEGAARADGRIRDFGVFVLDKNNKVYGGQGPPTISLNYSDAPAAHGVRGLEIVEGRAPRTAKEVVLDRSTAAKAGLYRGSEINLVSTKGLMTVRLVGLADYPEGNGSNGATILMWSTAAAQKMFHEGKDVYGTAWVTAEDGVTQAQLRDRVAKVLPTGFEAVTGDKVADEQASRLLQVIDVITLVLLVFAAISLVVGSFLIVNTFSMLVAQRSRELALLRALGASRRQVTRSVLFEAFVVGLIGSALGVAAGAVLAMAIRALFAQFGLDLSGTPLQFQPRTIGLGMLIGLVVTMLAAWFPARRSAKIPPVAALRDDVALPMGSIAFRFAAGMVLAAGSGWLIWHGLSDGVSSPANWVGGGLLLALIAIVLAAPVLAWPFLFVAKTLYAGTLGAVGRLAGENALRNPRRTAATASALMIGLALVTSMAITGSSATASVDKTVEESFLGDLVVTSLVPSPFPPSVARKAARIPGVGEVTRLWSRRALLIDVPKGADPEQVRLNGADAEGLSKALKVELVEGRLADLVDGTMLVPKSEGRKLGEKVRYRTPNGVISLRVVGLMAENPALDNPVTTVATLRKAGYERGDDALFLSLRGDADGFAVQRELQRQVKDLPTVSVFNQQEFANEQRAQIDRLVLMIYALLGLALVVAVLGVVNTLSLSVVERTKEIGLLRAVGLARPQLRRMVALEAIAISLLGGLLGVVAGIGGGYALMTLAKAEGLEVIAVPWGQLALFLVAAAVIGVLAAALPARRAARLDVLRAIATE